MNNLDELLRSADPNRQPITMAPKAAERLAVATIDASAGGRRARRRRTTVVIAGAAAFLVLGSGAVSYAVGGIHTGWLVPPNSTENGHAGDEELNLSDPAILDVVRQEAGKVALPQGTSYDVLLARYPIPPKDGHGFVGTQQTITEAVQGYASCAWMKDWIAAPARRSEDLAFMSGNFPSWDSELTSVVSSLAGGDSRPLIRYASNDCGA